MKESQRSYRLSIVIAVQNNADTLYDVVSDVRRSVGRSIRNHEIIIVDDASTDSTENVGKKLAARSAAVKYYRLDPREGVGRALKRGLDLATGEWVFYTTGDGSFNYRELRQMFKDAHNADLIVGYREFRDLSPWHKITLAFHNALLRWFFGLRVRDPQCAYKLIRQNVLKEIVLLSERESFDCELLIRAIRSGFRVSETPVQLKKPNRPWGIMPTIAVIWQLLRLTPKVGKIHQPRHHLTPGRIRMYIRRQWRRMLDRPLEASLDISTRCELKCISCNLWNQPPQPELSSAFWANRMDELYRFGVRRVVLIGAEPLMREDIGRIVRAASACGLGVTVFTNGLQLSNRAAELVESGIDRLVCSLDGPNPSVHDGLRGTGGAFNQAMEGVHQVIEQSKSQSISPPDIVFHTTVSIANHHVIGQMLRFADREGAALTLQAICRVPKADVMRSRYRNRVIASQQYMDSDGDLLLSQELVEKTKRQIHQRANAKNNLSVKAYLAISNQHLAQGTFPIAPCSHVHHTISISAQGNVYPCAMLANYHYGSLEKQSVWEIWQGNRRKEFLKHLEETPYPVCRYCCHYLNNLTPGQVVRVLMGMTLN
jgi:radical SAM protein with 4Fe4S-binding SPASM domain